MTTTTIAPPVLRPQRLALRLPLRTRIEDLEPAIGIFHRCLQRGWLEGQLIDVADYRHVPGGPGVMLVGHDVDLALQPEALVVTRKRSSGDGGAATQLTDLLRMAATAVEVFAYDGTLDVDADLGRATVTLLDRALARELDAPAEALAAAIAPSLSDAWGTEPEARGVDHDDPRRAPEVRAEAGTDVDASDLLELLGGSRAPGQSDHDITVEEFAELRDRDDVVVLDVREESEYETVNLGGTLLPLAELEERIDEVDRDATVLVHCRAGWRGGKATAILREHGIDAWNVNGALVAWADRIDPATVRY